MSEKPPIKMIKRGSFLAPATPFDEGLLEGVDGSSPVFVRISQPRNPKRLRLYFAVLRKVRENLQQEVSEDALHGFVKLKCGIVEPIKMRNGDVVEMPGSVAFDSMTEEAFREFLEKAMALFASIVPPHVLEREAQKELGNGA